MDMPHSAIQRFVSRAQVAFFEHDKHPAELVRRLEESARDLMTTLDDIPISERPLARETLGWVFLRAIRKHGLVADEELARAVVSLVARESIDRECACLFKRWSNGLKWNAQSIAPIDPRVGRALTFVRRAYRSRRISLDRTAKVAGVSSWYLDRLLKEQTGRTFVEQLRVRRIQAAIPLVLAKKLPQKQIACAVGYSAAPQLRRDFRKVVGSSAKLYRSQNLIANNKN